VCTKVSIVPVRLISEEERFCILHYPVLRTLPEVYHIPYASWWCPPSVGVFGVLKYGAICFWKNSPREELPQHRLYAHHFISHYHHNTKRNTWIIFLFINVGWNPLQKSQKKRPGGISLIEITTVVPVEGTVVGIH
jgi:hypothetical protein